jgi:hypothetical protein
MEVAYGTLLDGAVEEITGRLNALDHARGDIAAVIPAPANEPIESAIRSEG